MSIDERVKVLVQSAVAESLAPVWANINLLCARMDAAEGKLSSLPTSQAALEWLWETRKVTYLSFIIICRW